MPPQIDPTIKALASTIGELETGTSSPEAYTKKGKSGEYGRYQFMPDTYKVFAKKYLGDANAQPSVENQNKIVYERIKERKAAGLNPAQILSEWNSGRKDAYAQNWKGVNKYGVEFDTPEYVRKGSAIYQQKKASGIITPDVPAPQLNPQGSFFSDVGDTLVKGTQGVSDSITRSISGEINPLSGLIQGVGAVAGAVGGLATNTLEHTPVIGSAVKGIEGLIGKGVKKAADTQVGQKVIKGVQDFAQAHPELAGNVEAGVDIASAIPILKGVGVVKDIVKGGVGKALHGAVDDVLETVSPKLSAAESAEALTQRGTVQKGLLRETQLAPDKRMQGVADAVRTNVPKFNASKPLLTNIAETQKVVKKMADDLKKSVVEQGADRIYTFKELSSKLNSLEVPLLIASDTTMTNAYKRVIKKALEISKAKGGKVSNLLDARQEFDGFVRKQFPNLYSSDTLTPMRQAVKDIRGAITDFTAENLPEGVGLKDSLLTQHKLITAMENMAEKAVKGGTKELGTNALDRFGNRHPVMRGLMKAGTKAAVEGTGIGTVLRIMQ